MKISTKLLSMFSAFCALVLLGFTANAQGITVAGGSTANQLAQALVGSNVTVTNATLVGATGASGTFSQGASSFPLSDGIILTSGNINNATGPNNAGNVGTDNSTSGDSDLDAFISAPYVSFDANILEFDVSSNCNTLTFEYIFASEEYPEYGCQNFNDPFAFIISGPGFASPTNIALVPGTTSPVTIDNVINSPGTGCVSNPTYYVDNAGGLGVQYDGYTVPMIAAATIQPCQTYHIKIVIGDAGDGVFDSAIFLKGAAVSCTPTFATASVTALECGLLGAIDVNTGSATGPFTYSWTGPGGFTATTEDVTGLVTPGDYTVDIAGFDCSSSGQFSYTVTEIIDIAPPVFLDCPGDLIITSQNPDCAFVTPNIPIPSVTDDCSVVTFTSNYAVADSFAIGTITPITYIATDAAGNADSCTFNVVVNAQPLGIVFNPLVWPNGSNIRCFGNSNGKVEAEATGGCLPYTYYWEHPFLGTQINSTPVNTGLVLPAGWFAVTVEDGNGTIFKDSVNLLQNPQLLAVVTATPILCAGDSSTVTVTAAGGGAPYGGQNIYPGITPTYPGPPVGSFTGMVADGNGCRASNSVMITEPAQLSITATPEEILCFGDSTQVNITTVGGTAPFIATAVATGDTAQFTVSAGFSEVAGPAYTYLVTDANGCTDNTTIGVIEPGQLAASAVQLYPIPCYGDTCTVRVTVASGTEPYNGTGDFPQFAGTEYYPVEDSNGCVDTAVITVLQPSQLIVSISATSISCNGDSSIITVTASGATAPYTGTGTFTEASGTYFYTVTDANGCSVTDSVTLTEPTELVMSVLATGIACNGGISSVTVSGSGGTAPYLGTGTFAETAGTYTYTVTDANGCSVDSTITITEPTPVVASATSTAIACAGDSTTITVSGSGGMPMYTGGYTGEGIFTEVAGTYTYIVTDMNGCTGDVTITVTEPTPVLASATATSIACTGDSTTITVSGSGGMPMYTGGYAGEGTFTGIAGTYTYPVTDMNGCTDSVTITVTEPTQLVVSISATGIACNGESSDITVTATGGTAPYTGTGTFSETAGTYTYAITDANGCTVIDSITVTEPTPVVASATATSIACFGDSTMITVTATGGMPMYTGGYSGEGTFTEVAGTYTYTVTDMNGCSSDVTITVTEPTPVIASATATSIACAGDSTTITVSGSGGMPMYTGGYTGEGAFTEVAGTYTYVVTDMSGCIDSVTITVTEPTQLVVSISATGIACNGGSSDVTVTATGGTAPYTGTGTFSETAGTYTYTISDANGCTVIDSITVTEPTPVVASATATSIACFGDSTTITVTATGGMPMYTGGYAGEGTFTEVAGTYTYTVTDMNGCSSDVTITVTEPTPVIASATATSIACAGDSTTITVSGSGGMPMYTGGYTGEGAFTEVAGTYTYAVTDMSGCIDSVTITVTEPTQLVVSISATGIACNGESSDITVTAAGGTAPYTGTGTFSETAGTYTYTISDANGCTVIDSITVTEPTPVVASATATSIACFGDSTTITVTATGGMPMYTGGYAGEGTFTEVAGTYTYTVADMNGCSSDVTITVSEPAQLIVSSTATSINCNGGSSDVTVTATGGTAPYTGTGTFSETAGTYTYTVTDANGCTSITTVTITEPSQVVAASSATSIDCNGGSSDVTVTATGGTAPYTGTGTFSETTGTYSYTVADANGCTSTTTVTITEPTQLVASSSATSIDCNSGSSDVTVTAIGGTAPYTGTGTFSETAGTYTYTVTDANGCTSTTTVTITEPTPVVATSSATSIDCNGGSSDVTVTATGGTAPYTGTGTFSETAGTYTYTVTDANGCTSTTTVTITEPSQVVAASSATSIDCNGGSSDVTVTATGGTAPYTGTGTFSEIAGTYTYTVTDANGCTSTTAVTITEPTQLVASSTTTSIDCNGGSSDVTVTATGGTAPYTGVGTFTETAGTYTYTVTDANGCTSTTTVTITEPTQLVASSIATSIDCNGGSSDVTVTATGGTAPYTGVGIFSETSGTYTYTVTDANGCTSTTTVTITEPTAITMTLLSSTNPTCGVSDGEASMNAASGGTAGYSYDWTPGNPSGDGTTSVTGLTDGIWTCTVTDANGCINSTAVTLVAMDTVPPTAVCQDLTVFLDGSGSASIVASDIDGGSSDLCGPVTFSASQTTFDCTNIFGAPANNLVITAAYDAGLTGGTPKGIELFALADIADLSNYGIGSANNGGGTDGEEFTFPAVAVTAGTYIYVASEATQFTNFFGFAPDYTDGSMGINGDDAVELFFGGSVIDVFGDINLDGTGQPWDYLDGWASRNTGTGPDGSTFALANWSFSGVNVLDNQTTNATATSPIPVGTYAYAPAPGPTPVTLTVTDASGNTSTCLANVTVSDSTAPIAVCQDITVFLDGSGTASIVAADLDNGSTDNCGIESMMASTTDFTCADLGANTVTLTVTDDSGNTSTCTSTVTVSDSILPVAICQDITVFLDGSGTVSIVAADLDNGSSDNCSTVTFAASPAAFTCANVGANTVTLTVTDGSGNTSTCTSTVTVSDSTAPEAVCQDITVFLDGSGTASIVAADLDGGSSDNCSTVTLAASSTSFTCANVGPNTVTLTVTDGSGNTSMCTSTVTVSDSIAPIASCQDITVFLDGSGTASILAADLDNGSSDNCSVVTLSASPIAFTCADIGANTVTLTVTDVSGNTSTCTSTVTVSDSIAPIASCQDITVFLDGAGVASIVAADIDGGSSDNCSTVTLAASSTTFTCADLGTNTVTLTVTDGSGNTSMCTSTVTISDTIVPVPDAASLADETAVCEVTSLTAPTATDNCSATVTVTNDATFPITAQGTTVVTWTFNDGNGNIATQTQNVVLNDLTAPVADVATLSDITAECEVTSFTDPTATDDCGGTVTVTNDATLPISAQGTTTVTWTYTDENGNASTQTQNVVITDVTAPVADSTSLPDVIGNCEVTSLIDPTATDNCSGTLIITNDAVFPISGLGSTTVVTWTYDDGNGNTSTQTQNVIIDDFSSPLPNAAPLPDVTGECSVDMLPTAPTANDACSGTITGVMTSAVTFPITTPGVTLITWEFNDGNGNITTQSQNIIVDDVSAPVPDVATLADVTGTCSIDQPTAPTATDNCSGAVTATTPTVFPITAIGTTVIVWEYVDADGNISTQTQNAVNSGVDATVTVSADGATITANTAGATYAWVNCDFNTTIAGETNQSFTPAANGNYAVIVSEGICSDTSACETVSTVGIDKLSSELLTIYPNPSLDGYFTVSYEGTIEAIDVVDMLGRVIELPTDLSSGTVNGSELAAGRYMIRVLNEQSVITTEIVIAR